MAVWSSASELGEVVESRFVWAIVGWKLALLVACGLCAVAWHFTADFFHELQRIRLSAKTHRRLGYGWIGVLAILALVFG